MAHLANEACTRIIVFVDAMTKPDETKFIVFILGACDVFRDVTDVANLIEHVQCGFIGTAVCRAP